MRRLSCNPSIEVIGVAVRAFTEHVTVDEMKGLLKKHGLENIGDDEWYQMLNLLDLLNELTETSNWSENYVAMGMKRAEVAKMPPEAANMTFGQFLMNWNKIYQLQHRNGDVGQLQAEKLTDTHFKVTFDIIYPDDFIYGVAYGMARRFLPNQTKFVIKYDDSVLQMDKGGKETVLDITWN